MAIIVRKERQGINPSAPKAPPAVARNSATYQALAKVGAEGAALFGEIAVRHKNLQDEKFASESALNDTVEYQRKFTELQKQSSGGVMPDGRRMSEHVSEWVKDRQDSRREAAPSAAASDIYTRHMGSFYAREQIRSEQVEIQQMTESYDRSLMQDSNNVASEHVRMGPNPELATTQVQLQWERIEAGQKQGLYSMGDAADRKQKVAAIFNGAQIESFITNKQYARGLSYLGAGKKGTIQGLALDGETARKLGFTDGSQSGDFVLPDFNTDTPDAVAAPGGMDLTSGMNPEERARDIRRMREGLEAETREKLTRYSTQLDNYKVALQNGEPRDAEYEGELVSLLRFVDKTGRTSNEMRAQFEALGAVNEEMASIATLPRGKMGEAAAQIDSAVDRAKATTKSSDPYLGEKVGESTKKFARARFQAEIARRDADFAGSQIAADKELGELATQAMSGPVGIDGVALGELSGRIDARAKSMGEPAGYRVLPKEVSGRIKGVLDQLPINQAADVVTQLRTDLGPAAPAVFSQLLKDKVLPEGVRVALNTEGASQAWTREIVGNAFNGGKFMKDGAIISRPDVKKADLDASMSESFREYESAMRQIADQGEAEGTINAFRSQVAAQRAKIMSKDLDMTAAKATELAVETVFQPFHPPVKAGNSSILLPRVVKGQPTRPEVVESFMRTATTPDGLKALGVDIKTGAFGPYAFSDNLARQIEDEGRVDYDDVSQTLRLRVVDRNGELKDVIGKDGKPVSVSLESLHTNTPDFVLKGTQSFLQKWSANASKIRAQEIELRRAHGVE